MGRTVKKNGQYANGRQRWYCLVCLCSFSWSNKQNKRLRQFTWFKYWITEGYSVRQLIHASCQSRDVLYRIIGLWLLAGPKPDSESLSNYRHILFDATFLHRPVSIVAVMDGERYQIIAGQYNVPENSESALTNFFLPLRQRGLHPESVTVDGNPRVIKVFKLLWPNIIIQRCVVHIQRQGLMWCRQRPKRTDAKALRQLFLQATSITNHNQKRQFLEAVEVWEQAYGTNIQQQKEQGKVFSDVKRARSMLIKALPDMFHYLTDCAIPPTTNGLEGYFSRLKHRYRSHRGLAQHKLSNYFAWYFSLKIK